MTINHMRSGDPTGQILYIILDSFPLKPAGAAMRNTSGRKVQRLGGLAVRGDCASIQGVWTPMLLGGSKFDVNVVEAEVRKMDRADVNLVKVGIDARYTCGSAINIIIMLRDTVPGPAAPRCRVGNLGRNVPWQQCIRRG